MRFGGLAVLFLCSGSLWAQVVPPLTCTAQAGATPLVRAEGLTELVGDIIISCTGGTPLPPGSPLPLMDLEVSLNTNVTSRLVDAANGFSEAILFIDEPSPATQTLCGSLAAPYTSTGANGPICAGTAGTPRANAFLARQANPTSLIWQGIPFDPPARQRTLRLTNIRVNAAQLGAQPVTVEIVITHDNRVLRLDLLEAGIPQHGGQSLNFSIAGARTCLQCRAANVEFFNNPSQSLGSPSDSLDCNGQFLQLRYTELFHSAFRRRNLALPTPPTTGSAPPTPISQDTLGFPFQTESGFYKSVSTDRWPGPPDALGRTEPAGLADHGTNLIARFTNVQSGVQVWVPTTAPVVSASGARTGTAAVSGAGNSLYTQVPIVGGTGQAVWEIVNGDTTLLETVDIPIIFSWPSQTGVPALGTMSVQGQEGPDESWRFANARPVFASPAGKDPALDESGRSAGALIPGKEHIPRFRDVANGDPGLRGLAALTIVDCGGEQLSPVRGALATGAQLAVTTGALPVVYRQQGNLPEPFQFYVLARGEPLTNIRADPPSVPWMTVESTGTNSPATFVIRVDPRGLAPGNYSPTFVVRGTGFTAGTVTIPVTVQSAGPHLTRWGATNTASYEPNLIAAGELLTFFGERFGPDSLVAASGGTFPTTLGETRVLFDGVAAPLIYAAKNQVSAIAPFSLAGRANTLVQIEYRGERSTAVRIPIAPAVPGLLTANASGSGQAAALNQDYSYNSVIGEEPGRYVIVYGVGGPVTNPPGVDGGIAALPLPVFTESTIQVFLDGVLVPASDVAYVGPAPGLVNGVWQANIRLPANAKPNSRMYLRIQFGDFITQQGVFVSVR